MQNILITYLLLLGYSLLGLSFAVFDKKANEEHLLEWIVSNGGYWNSNLELRYDGSIPDLYGLYAKEDIPAQAILASIPWSCVIHVEHQRTSSEDPDRFDSDCNLVQRLFDEIQKYKTHMKSHYSYFVKGLLHTAEEHSKLLPAYWSEPGKELLSTILYDNGTRVLPPHDMFLQEDTWRINCESTVDPTATILVMTHGEDFGMVPLTDKFNSRGGNYTGAYFSVENGQGDIALEIRALRPLQKGEHVTTDYRDYGDIGTPELLRDYGFVETFPQRWIFHRYRLTFDLVQTTDSEFQVQWHRASKYWNDPDVDRMVTAHIKNQLSRLEQTVRPLLRNASIHQDGPSQFELNTIQQFSDSLIRALKLVLQTRNAANLALSSNEQEEL